MSNHGHNDDDASKVIHIFERHRRGEHLHFPIEEGGELIVSPDGFNYVSFREDNPLPSSPTHPQAEAGYLEVAHARHYIFKFIEPHKDYQRIDNYYVPGDKLHEFIQSISRRPGQLIEIKPFIPDFIG